MIDCNLHTIRRGIRLVWAKLQTTSARNERVNTGRCATAARLSTSPFYSSSTPSTPTGSCTHPRHLLPGHVHHCKCCKHTSSRCKPASFLASGPTTGDVVCATIVSDAIHAATSNTHLTPGCHPGRQALLRLSYRQLQPSALVSAHIPYREM